MKSIRNSNKFKSNLFIDIGQCVLRFDGYFRHGSIQQDEEYEMIKGEMALLNSQHHPSLTP